MRYLNQLKQQIYLPSQQVDLFTEGEEMFCQYWQTGDTDLTPATHLANIICYFLTKNFPRQQFSSVQSTPADLY